MNESINKSIKNKDKNISYSLEINKDKINFWTNNKSGSFYHHMAFHILH